MTEVFLIRHGECAANTPETYNEALRAADPPLTPKGVEQARELAARCRDIRFDRLYASDLKRAAHTAQILGEAVCLKPVARAALREIDMGDLFLRPWSDFPELYERWARHDADIPYPGGENGFDMWRRVKPILDEIIAGGFERVAIVCHGGTIRATVCGALGFPQEARFFLGCPLENTSITVLRWERGAFFLHAFNDFAHLSPSPGPCR